MKQAPCKDCPDRQVGCHGSCDKYLAYKKEMTAINEAIYKQKVADNRIHEHFARCARKKHK